MAALRSFPLPSGEKAGEGQIVIIKQAIKYSNAGVLSGHKIAGAGKPAPLHNNLMN